MAQREQDTKDELKTTQTSATEKCLALTELSKNEEADKADETNNLLQPQALTTGDDGGEGDGGDDGGNDGGDGDLGGGGDRPPEIPGPDPRPPGDGGEEPQLPPEI